MDVDAILSAHQSKYKPTDVSKEIELQFDLGNLLVTDLNNIDTESLRKNKDEYLRQIMRDNTQLLINEIWKLPIERENDVIVAQLPPPKTILPREKPIPKPKPPTKWEQFAKVKGINKKRRSRMVFDEKAQEWKPRWGYKRINDPKEEWLIEVPKNSNPYEDPFEKKSEARKERIAKNEYQRLCNIARAEKSGKVKVPLPPAGTKNLNKHQMVQAMTMARKSTASIGKFTPQLSSEPTAKHSGKKNKFQPLVSKPGEEKELGLSVLEKMSKKTEILDTAKATNKLMAAEQQRTHKRKLAENEEGIKRKKSKKGVSRKAASKPTKLMKQRAKKRKRR